MVKVYSEIGKLIKVLLHEPGEEIANLLPEYLGELLFDDIPWLPLAKEEHQKFADTFRKNGVEVVYLVDLVAESIPEEDIKQEFIKEYISEADILKKENEILVEKYLNSIHDRKELVKKVIAGIKCSELHIEPENDRLFVTMPMPNLYFQRDPFVIIGNGVSLNTMYSKTRCRETLLGKYIFKYHKDYKGTKLFYDRNQDTHIEGGDILVISDKTLLIGISQRTQFKSIEKLAKNLFTNSDFDTIIALSIPESRTFMHLDTVFTQVDYDKFLYHKESLKETTIYRIKMVNDAITHEELNKNFDDVISDCLGRKVTFIPCGGNDNVCADREQWSDGSNTVAIAPGEVICYDRNEVTNQMLKNYGIKVHTIPSSELSRGRGGPRCMCMPLEREKI